ncbi:MAG: bifunctional demethylmenaquinone methyltransferase/2-methoxy-6-polyprenyl-1,4-benzoquinol methylase UbiE [Thermoanaerobaculia bacterium]
MSRALDGPQPEPGSGAMFDRIAGRYDLLNRLLSLGFDRRWRRRAVAALPQHAGARVLDVATGTADVALEVLRQNPEAEVVGVDPAPAMVRIGAAKAAAAGVAVELREGRAESLPFADRSFDGVTIAFGIRNVRDRDAALREMARVTRADGRVVILELTEPGSGLLSMPARIYVHHLVPRLGALLSGAREYRYLQSSIGRFPAPADFARQLAAAGLEVLETRPMTFGACCLFVARPGRDRPGRDRPGLSPGGGS